MRETEASLRPDDERAWICLTGISINSHDCRCNPPPPSRLSDYSNGSARPYVSLCGPYFLPSFLPSLQCSRSVCLRLSVPLQRQVFRAQERTDVSSPPHPHPFSNTTRSKRGFRCAVNVWCTRQVRFNPEGHRPPAQILQPFIISKYRRSTSPW